MATKKTKTHSRAYSVLVNPRVTEKAAILGEQNVYTFNVGPTATKVDIARAIEEVYSVRPIKVTVTKVPAKKVQRRGVAGVVSATKKAYVFLPKGKTIEFM